MLTIGRYLSSFAVNVDTVPLVVVETHFRRPDLDVEFATAQIYVERYGSIAQGQCQVIFAITCDGNGCHLAVAFDTASLRKKKRASLRPKSFRWLFLRLNAHVTRKLCQTDG